MDIIVESTQFTFVHTIFKYYEKLIVTNLPLVLFLCGPSTLQLSLFVCSCGVLSVILIPYSFFAIAGFVASFYANNKKIQPKNPTSENITRIHFLTNSVRKTTFVVTIKSQALAWEKLKLIKMFSYILVGVEMHKNRKKSIVRFYNWSE